MTDTIVADGREVREFITTYIAQAKAATAEIERPGLLNMILVNPADEDSVTSVYRYAFDDPDLTERMIEEAIEASAAGHNVYVEGRTVRVGLIGKARGEFNDTIAVFALVVDSDNDKSKAWIPTVPTSLAVETSPSNAHYWFFLDRAIDPATGKTLGDRLRAATNSDKDTGVVTQPYRVAGTVNYPGKKKRARGRVVTPTHSLGFDPETLWTPETLEREFPPTQTTNGSGGDGGGGADESSIPADTLDAIRDPTEQARGLRFWNIVVVLKDLGFTIDGIVALFEKYPNGTAAKFRGRLRHQVKTIWDKLNSRQQQRQQQQPRNLPIEPFRAITLPMLANYSIKGIFPMTGLAVVWGPPKSGKSFWTFDAVMHIATGRSYRGRNVRKGTVVYLALEGGVGFAGRVEAWRRRHKPPEDVPFYLLTVPIDLIADHTALIDAIREQVPGDPSTIVIDTLNRAMFGNENESKDMGEFIRAADTVRTAFNCLFIVVHHCGVAGSRPRGHTSLAGADDAQIMVERDKDGNVIAKVEFMKDAEGGATIASKLEPVELDHDAEGEARSSCIIVPADSVAAGMKLTKVQRFAFDLLKRIIDTEGMDAPAEANLPGLRVCRNETWRERFYAEYPADKQNTKKKAFLRAILDLEEEGLIGLFREFVFMRDKRDKS
jgi:hypothetical protein